METAKLVLEYLKALSWPLVTIVAIWLFRSELTAMLSRIREAKLPGGVSLSFAAELSEAKAISAIVQNTPSKAPIPETSATLKSQNLVNARLLQLGLQPSPSGVDLAYYDEVSKRDPSLALAGVRIELEIAARNLAQGFKVSYDPKDSVSLLFSRLQGAGAVGAEQAELARRVLRLCNLAVHGQAVTRQQATEVVAMTTVLLNDYLAWLSWGFKVPWPSSSAG